MTMRRRPAAIVLATATLLLATTACSKEDAADAQVVRSEVARSKPAADDAKAGGAVVRHVGTSLYAPIATEAGTGNLAFSPTSIALALGMTRAGAQGDSAEQLDELLGAPDPAALHDGLNGLALALADRAGSVEDAKGGEGEVALDVADSIWAQDDVDWQAPYLDTLQRSYGAGVHPVDYVDDPDGARRAVNAWVADRTHDRIPDLIPEDLFDADTRLTLVNALYLAAPWDVELDEQGDRPFTTTSGEVVQVPTMGDAGSYRYQGGDGWQAVTLPYAGGQLAMTLLVPDAGKLAAVEAAFDDDLLERVLTGGEQVPLTVSLPRFDLDQAPSLGTALRAVGVTAPFETEDDFRPMTDDPDAQPLRIDDVVHRATVTVDEQGTEAAAATAVVFETVGGAITDVELEVDRPFLFVIQDVDTATPLFIGRVANPTER